MNKYVHFIYRITQNFPKYELYGTTSQVRRSSISIILNHIEGYARRKPLVHLNFLETSYGSLQESKYLLEFTYQENYTNQDNYNYGAQLAEEIARMLWKDLGRLNRYIHSNQEQ